MLQHLLPLHRTQNCFEHKSQHCSWGDELLGRGLHSAIVFLVMYVVRAIFHATWTRCRGAQCACRLVDAVIMKLHMCMMYFTIV